MLETLNVCTTMSNLTNYQIYLFKSECFNNDCQSVGMDK